MPISETLSRFTSTLRYEDIPEAVARRARHLMLDAVGIALASGRYDFAKCALDGIRRLGQGDADIIGFTEQLALRDAVLLNGLLVHGLDYDDTYLPGSMHVTASNVPTAIAVGAQTCATGRELLTACTIGLEIAARLAAAGKGGFQKTGFHATGVCAAFSCALVAGRLLGLDAAQLTMAQGIALSTASGTMQPIRDGSWTKRMHPGWAGSAGITAASMAAGGYIGPVEAYEGHFGFFPTYLGSAWPDADLTRITEALGERWEIERVSIKLYPAGHLSHTFMTATRELVREHDIRPDQVESVHTLVGEGAIPLICEPVENKHRPTTSYMAQFSLQYGIACCLAKRRFGLLELESDSFDDPALHALARKVSYEVDPNAGFPKFRTGEVIIKLVDGRQFRRREVIHPDEPTPDSAIVEKFMENATLVMPETRAQVIRDMILGIENESNARRISSALSGR